MREIGIGIVGGGYMGKAHAVAMSAVGAVFNTNLALGMMNGLAIVALAIVFDRVTQEYGRRIQKHRGQIK